MERKENGREEGVMNTWHLIERLDTDNCHNVNTYGYRVIYHKSYTGRRYDASH